MPDVFFFAYCKIPCNSHVKMEGSQTVPNTNHFVKVNMDLTPPQRCQSPPPITLEAQRLFSLKKVQIRDDLP